MTKCGYIQQKFSLKIQFPRAQIILGQKPLDSVWAGVGKMSGSQESHQHATYQSDKMLHGQYSCGYVPWTSVQAGSVF